jgi:hypothetical protein
MVAVQVLQAAQCQRRRTDERSHATKNRAVSAKASASETSVALSAPPRRRQFWRLRVSMGAKLESTH